MKIKLLTLIILILIYNSGFCQYGTVKSFLKTSRTVGNFPISIDVGAGFGFGTCGLGDFNKDGTNDIATSSINGLDNGIIYLTLLRPNGEAKQVTKLTAGLNGLPSSFPYSDLDLAYFGWSIDALGDVNGDGITDLAIGNPVITGGYEEGYVFILLMNIDGTVKNFTLIGDQLAGFNDDITYSNFGTAIAGVGDIDKDGIPDIAVSGSSKQTVWILFLNNDGTVKGYKKISSSNTFVSNYMAGGAPFAVRFGSSLSGMADFNNDGFFDLLVGSSSYRTSNIYGSASVLFLDSLANVIGLVPIHYGVANFTDSIINSWDSLNPITSQQGFAQDVTVIGDINGDGSKDIAISAYKFSDTTCTNCGAVGIFMLDSTANIVDYQRVSINVGGFTGSIEQNDRFGFSIANVGDIDGDSIYDILVSAPEDDDGGTNTGAVYLINLNGVPDPSTVKEIDLYGSISTYPNPNTGSFKIEIQDQVSENLQWKLYSITGKEVVNGQIAVQEQSQEVKTTNLPDGLYILRLQGSNSILTRKIIISK